MTLRPVGSLPSSVYWRRRLLVLVPLLFLIGLTVYVACSPSGRSEPTAAQALRPTTSAPAAKTSPTPSPAPATGASSGSPAPTPVSSAPVSPAPAGTPCVATALTVVAATSAPSYAVDTEPVLFLQVTNTGAAPCTENLADSQVELRVYSGDARVWGSHDCKIEPGTSVQTLAPNQPVRLSITWTGLSSQPGCAGQRTRVPAGNYTLHALLGGVEGATAPFALT